MPDMSQCQNWQVFCSNQTLAAAFPMFCSGDAADGAWCTLRPPALPASLALASSQPCPGVCLHVAWHSTWHVFLWLCARRQQQRAPSYEDVDAPEHARHLLVQGMGAQQQ